MQCAILYSRRCLLSWRTGVPHFRVPPLASSCARRYRSSSVSLSFAKNPLPISSFHSTSLFVDSHPPITTSSGFTAPQHASSGVYKRSDVHYVPIYAARWMTLVRRKLGVSSLSVHPLTSASYRTLSTASRSGDAAVYNKAVTESLKDLLHKKEVAFVALTNKYISERHRSYQYAEFCLWATWGFLAVILLLLFIGTYHVYSWNVIEPITYLSGLILIWVCLLWYKKYGNEFSFASFRRGVAERHFLRQQMPPRFLRKQNRANIGAMTPYRSMTEVETELRVLSREIHHLRKQITHSNTLKGSP